MEAFSSPVAGGNPQGTPKQKHSDSRLPCRTDFPTETPVTKRVENRKLNGSDR